jgi:predicted transcriptional regulator
MSMARLKKMVSFALDPDLLKRLDAWLSRQDPAISKTAVVESALRAWLDAKEKRRG